MDANISTVKKLFCLSETSLLCACALHLVTSNEAVSQFNALQCSKQSSVNKGESAACWIVCERGQDPNGWVVSNALLVLCTLPHGRCGVQCNHSPSLFPTSSSSSSSLTHTSYNSISFSLSVRKLHPRTWSLHPERNQPFKKKGIRHVQRENERKKDTEVGKSKRAICYLTQN